MSGAENNLLTIKRTSAGGRNERSEKRRIWPADRPDFLHFTLTKENRDTQWAVNLVARLCQLRPHNFSMAGMKDRRAVTAQRMCVYRVEKQRMEAAAKGLRHGVWLSDFNYCSEKLQLGSLWGNRFNVVLRGVDAASLQGVHPFSTRAQEWERVGFLNYFGSQRFGTCGVSTAKIGQLILGARWEEAVKELLAPRDEAHGRNCSVKGYYVPGLTHSLPFQANSARR